MTTHSRHLIPGTPVTFQLQLRPGAFPQSIPGTIVDFIYGEYEVRPDADDLPFESYFLHPEEIRVITYPKGA